MKYEASNSAANLREKVVGRDAGRGNTGSYEDDVIKYG